MHIYTPLTKDSITHAHLHTERGSHTDYKYRHRSYITSTQMPCNVHLQTHPHHHIQYIPTDYIYPYTPIHTVYTYRLYIPTHSYTYHPLTNTTHAQTHPQTDKHTHRYTPIESKTSPPTDRRTQAGNLTVCPLVPPLVSSLLLLLGPQNTPAEYSRARSFSPQGCPCHAKGLYSHDIHANLKSFLLPWQHQ